MTGYPGDLPVAAVGPRMVCTFAALSVLRCGPTGKSTLRPRFLVPDEIGRAMPTVDELLKLAKDHYAKARSAREPGAKRRLVQLGNQYLKEAVQAQRDRSDPQPPSPEPHSDRTV